MSEGRAPSEESSKMIEDFIRETEEKVQKELAVEGGVNTHPEFRAKTDHDVEAAVEAEDEEKEE